MNELRFKLGSPIIKLDKLDSKIRERLTIKDNYGKNEIIFDMDAGTIIDIVSSILFQFTPDQIEGLAGKIVYEIFDAEKIAFFVTAIKVEQTEYEKDKRKFDFKYPISAATGS